MDDLPSRTSRRRVLPRKGDLELVLDPTDVLLASFPRSGNTWLRFILADLLIAGSEPYPQTLHELNRVVFDVYKGLGEPSHLPFRIIKIHDRHPGTNHRFVTIVRHPADAIVSYFHYNRLRGRGKHIEGGVDAFAGDLVAGWVDHVQTYLDALDSGRPGILVTYEDLHADPFPVVSAVCNFVGIEASEQQIGEAIARRSFANLQRLEASGPLTEKAGDPTITSERFFRQGTIGTGSSELTDSTMELLSATALPVYREASRRATRR